MLLHNHKNLNHYALLRISPLSSQEEIELAFKNFKSDLGRYSPGIHLTDVEIREKFPEIFAAYTTLLDPQKRQDYNLEMGIGEGAGLSHHAESEMEAEPSSSNAMRWLYYLGAIVVFGFVLYVFSQLYLL